MLAVAQPALVGPAAAVRRVAVRVVVADQRVLVAALVLAVRLAAAAGLVRRVAVAGLALAADLERRAVGLAVAGRLVVYPVALAPVVRPAAGQPVAVPAPQAQPVGVGPGRGLHRVFARLAPPPAYRRSALLGARRGEQLGQPPTLRQFVVPGPRAPHSHDVPSVLC